MIKILLTRPEDDSKDLQNKINMIPLVSEICPLIKIKKTLPSKIIGIQKFDLIIFTSKNAIRNFKNVFKHRGPVFTIGKSTKNCAYDYGFKNVISAEGNSSSVIRLFDKKYGKKKLNILHPTTVNSNNELDKFFRFQGSQYKKYYVYQIIKKNIYPNLFQKFIKEEEGYITIFSIVTAESFYEQIKNFELENFCSEKTFITISTNIAEEIRKLKIKNVIVLKEPYEDNLIEKLKSLKKVNILK